MQYRMGSISVVEGGNTVTGTSTVFLGNVKVGDSFKVIGENAIYQVISIVSDTQFLISPNYAGTNKTGARYQVCRDRTPLLGLAEINAGDEDWPYWLTNEVIRKLDTALTQAGQTGASRLIDLLDVHVGPVAPTDPSKTFWINTSGT